MNIDALAAELTDDPLGVGYSGMTNEEAAAALNTANRTAIRQVRGTWRTLMAELGPEVAVTVKAKLDAAAEANPAIAMAAEMLAEYGEGGGLDLGHHNTRAVIDQLAAGGVLTADEAAAIKAIAEEVTSRAQELGLGRVKIGHVQEARL